MLLTVLSLSCVQSGRAAFLLGLPALYLGYKAALRVQVSPVVYAAEQGRAKI